MRKALGLPKMERLLKLDPIPAGATREENRRIKWRNMDRKKSLNLLVAAKAPAPGHDQPDPA